MKRTQFLGLTATAIAALLQGLDAQCSGGSGRGVSGNAGGAAPSGPSTPSPSTPAPSTPSTPAPSQPSTPGPSQPNTPGGLKPGVTGGPGVRRPNTPRGIPIPMTRQPTAKAILKLDWDYPVAEKFKVAETGETTRASMIRKALPRAQAFAAIAKDDPRPLLVLRECNHCVGTDEALLNRSLNNEKTLLLANWFHCVKLPPEVLKQDHPFANLFPGDHPPHLFFASPDGSNVVTFAGDQKQTDLWKGMEKVLKASYKKSTKSAMRSMLRMLSRFDHLDIMEKDYQKMIRARILKDGPKAPQLKRLRAKLKKVQGDKKKAMKMAKAVCDLKLIVQPTPKKAEAVGGSR